MLRYAPTQYLFSLEPPWTTTNKLELQGVWGESVSQETPTISTNLGYEVASRTRYEIELETKDVSQAVLSDIKLWALGATRFWFQRVSNFRVETFYVVGADVVDLPSGPASPARTRLRLEAVGVLENARFFQNLNRPLSQWVWNLRTGNTELAGHGYDAGTGIWTIHVQMGTTQSAGLSDEPSVSDLAYFTSVIRLEIKPIVLPADPYYFEWGGVYFAADAPRFDVYGAAPYPRVIGRNGASLIAYDIKGGWLILAGVVRREAIWAPAHRISLIPNGQEYHFQVRLAEYYLEPTFGTF